MKKKGRFAWFLLHDKTKKAYKLAQRLKKLLPDLCGGDILAILDSLPRYERYVDEIGCDMVRKVA